jgi:hypothetical protein
MQVNIGSAWLSLMENVGLERLTIGPQEGTPHEKTAIHAD